MIRKRNFVGPSFLRFAVARGPFIDAVVKAGPRGGGEYAPPAGSTRGFNNIVPSPVLSPSITGRRFHSHSFRFPSDRTHTRRDIDMTYASSVSRRDGWLNADTVYTYGVSRGDLISFVFPTVCVCVCLAHSPSPG